jgi:CHAT domain-containing protein
LQAGQSARVRATTAEIDTLLVRLRDVEAQIEIANPAYWALQRPEPVTTADVQRALLDDQTVLVEYHLGARKSFAWVVDRGAISAVELAPEKAITDLARRYHDALSLEVDSLPAAGLVASTKTAADAGRKLAASVWDPIAAKTRGKRVVVVADGALQYVPFAALPAKSGEPVLVSNEVVYLPSASVLETIRRESRPILASAKVAVFADPVFSKNDPRFATDERDLAAVSASRAGDDGIYGRLRFSRREAEAIAESSPGSFQALDFSASKATLSSRNLRQYQILHFATHGTLNAEHPELSGLVFSLFDRNGRAQDGFLRLHEIYNLDLNADLVVLSACSTALGREVFGEGLIGLTRGFMYAGASRVVSSVWNVDDRASSLLMSRFYAAMLTRGLTPAAALREAQLSLLKDPRWSNPHYWAAFSLQGDWK